MAYYEDIVTLQNGETKCDLCEILVQDSPTSIEKHINDKGHGELYMKRLMIQNSVINKGNQMYCCMCEEKIKRENLIYHIQNSLHEQNIESIKKLIDKDGGFLILPEALVDNKGSIDCLICVSSGIAFNLEAINSHIATTKHKRGRSIVVQPFNAIFTVEDNKDELWCKFCKIYFENYVEIILEHVDQDPKHKNEMRKILLLIKNEDICIEKFLQDPTVHTALCKRCQIEVSCCPVNLESHIKGKKHSTS